MYLAINGVYYGSRAVCGLETEEISTPKNRTMKDLSANEISP